MRSTAQPLFDHEDPTANRLGDFVLIWQSLGASLFVAAALGWAVRCPKGALKRTVFGLPFLVSRAVFKKDYASYCAQKQKQLQTQPEGESICTGLGLKFFLLGGQPCKHLSRDARIEDLTFPLLVGGVHSLAHPFIGEPCSIGLERGLCTALGWTGFVV